MHDLYPQQLLKYALFKYISSLEYSKLIKIVRTQIKADYFNGLYIVQNPNQPRTCVHLTYGWSKGTNYDSWNRLSKCHMWEACENVFSQNQTYETHLIYLIFALLYIC